MKAFEHIVNNLKQQGVDSILAPFDKKGAYLIFWNKNTPDFVGITMVFDMRNKPNQ